MQVIFENIGKIHRIINKAKTIISIEKLYKIKLFELK